MNCRRQEACPLRALWLVFSSFLCHQRNEAKKMPLKIAAYILTKAGNRAQNKAGVLLLSLLPVFVSAQL